MRNTIFFAVTASFVLLSFCSTLEAQVLQRPASIVRVAVRTVAQPVIRVADTENYGPESQRYPYVIARPQDRQWIRETPVELRPNRPLHFWGNSVRRGLR